MALEKWAVFSVIRRQPSITEANGVAHLVSQWCGKMALKFKRIRAESSTNENTSPEM